MGLILSSQMFEFVRRHLEIVREKGHEWQIKVAVKATVIIAALSLAAGAISQKSFDRHGLAQLAAKGSISKTGRSEATARWK